MVLIIKKNYKKKSGPDFISTGSAWREVGGWKWEVGGGRWEVWRWYGKWEVDLQITIYKRKQTSSEKVFKNKYVHSPQ